MNVSYINPFIVATRNVFDSMVKLPLTIGKPYLKRPDDRLFKLYRVAAVIQLSGAGKGLCVLSLSEPTAFALVGGLVGNAPSKLDADCLDAVGEIANMIVGGAKKNLPGGLMTMSTPKVILSHQVVYPEGLPLISIPMDTGAGRFILEFGFHGAPEAAVVETKSEAQPQPTSAGNGASTEAATDAASPAKSPAAPTVAA